MNMNNNFNFNAKFNSNRIAMRSERGCNNFNNQNNRNFHDNDEANLSDLEMTILRWLKNNHASHGGAGFGPNAIKSGIRCAPQQQHQFANALQQLVNKGFIFNFNGGYMWTGPGNE